MTSADIVVAVFTACSSLRVLAYLPQIVKVCRDQNGASAISYTTWAFFGLSNASTMAYALVISDDMRLALVFGANTVCCIGILAFTALKRARFSAAAREPGAYRSAPAILPPTAADART